MSWIQRYKLRHFIRNSIWILPVFGIVAALVSVNCLDWIEQCAGWQSGFDPGSTLALFGTLAGSMFTFIVFLSSSLLLVVQLASAQLTPRIIGVVFRDRVTRFSLTLFTFTFTFALAVLVRISTSVPAITAYISARGPCWESSGCCGKKRRRRRAALHGQAREIGQHRMDE